jgi:predicted cobalt transporter CbtA
MDYNKIRKFCRVVRITVGLALILTGVIQLGAMNGAAWFFLGFIPLLAGIFNFCPLCIFTKKCDLPASESK